MTLDRDTRIAFIGAGRLGASLALAASRAGYRVAATSSRRPEQRAWLARHLLEAQACAAPGEAASTAGIVFLSVSDRAIADVCASIRWRSDQAVVHCSGALPLDALQAAAQAGAAVGGLHPLQTFPAAGAIERLSGASFAVEAPDGNLAAWLDRFATALGGVPFRLRAEQRAAYHASAVLSSGLLLSVTGLAAELWQTLGMSRERALASLLPLASASIDALAQKGLPAALTGPYVRGDVDTIRGHLAALRAARPELAQAYAALALASLPLATEQSGLDEATRDEIEAMLRDALRGDRR